MLRLEDLARLRRICEAAEHDGQQRVYAEGARETDKSYAWIHFERVFAPRFVLSVLDDAEEAHRMRVIEAQLNREIDNLRRYQVDCRVLLVDLEKALRSLYAGAAEASAVRLSAKEFEALMVRLRLLRG